MDKKDKVVKKPTKPNHFEQLLGGAGRPSRKAVAGAARSMPANKRLGKGNARGR